MTKLNKVERIKLFLKLHGSATRGEIVRFLIVRLTPEKNETNVSFDIKNYRGHYNQNLKTWVKNGHLNYIDGKYSLTKEGEESNLSFYQVLPSVYKKRNEHILSYTQEREKSHKEIIKSWQERALSSEKSEREWRTSLNNANRNLFILNNMVNSMEESLSKLKIIIKDIEVDCLK